MVESAPALALVFVQDKSVADDGRALGERGEEDTQVDNSFLKKEKKKKNLSSPIFGYRQQKYHSCLEAKCERNLWRN